MANDELFYDRITARYFKSTKDTVNEVVKKVNDNLEMELENVSKRGSIEIPRGLSDEEVLKMYHDEKINHQIDSEQIREIHEEGAKAFCKAIGIPLPRVIDHAWWTLGEPLV